MSTRFREPVDPDVDLHVPAQRRHRAFDPAVLGVIAAGGVLGSEARYALQQAVGHASDTWPWATWAINVSGCLLLGALMVVLTELTSPHRLLRPFLGVGVLGGYTTFSTAMVDVTGLLGTGHPGLAPAYLVGTAVAAVLAAMLGSTTARALGMGTRRRRQRRAAR